MNVCGTSEHYKGLGEKSLAFEDVDEIMKEYGVTRTDYHRKWANLRVQFLREKWLRSQWRYINPHGIGIKN